MFVIYKFGIEFGVLMIINDDSVFENKKSWSCLKVELVEAVISLFCMHD
jgi:hypothetical protein